MASAIVAFGPTFKPFQDIESSIRQYAHRLAGIPDDLFSIIDNIRKFDIELYSESTGISGKVSDYADDAFRFSLILMGDLEKSRALHRNIKAGFSLSNWTLRDPNKGIWAARTLNSLKKITERQSEKVKNIETNLKVLIADSAKSNPIAEAAQELGLHSIGYGRPITEAQEEYIKTASAADEGVGVRARWETIANEIEWLAQENEAIFCVFAINDKSPNVPKENKAFAELLNSIWDKKINSVANVVLFAGVASLLSTGIVVTAFKILKTLSRADPVGPNVFIGDAIHLAVSNASFMMPLFVFPIILVLFMRFSNLHERSYIYMNKFVGFPYFQLGKLFLYSAVLTIMVLNFFTGGMRIVGFAWALTTDGGIRQEVVQDYLGGTFSTTAMRSIAGAVFAVAIAIIFDVIERGKANKAAICSLAVLALSIVLVIFIGLGIETQEGYLAALKSDRGYSVAWYDLMVQDAVVITTFTISFVISIFAVGRKPGTAQ